MVFVILGAIIGNVPMMKVTALDVHKSAKIGKVYIKAAIQLVTQSRNVILRNATGALAGAIVTKPKNVRQICKLMTYVMMHATFPNVITTIMFVVILAVTMHYAATTLETFCATTQHVPMMMVTVLDVAKPAKTVKVIMKHKISEKLSVILKLEIGAMAGVTAIKMPSVHLTFS